MPPPADRRRVVVLLGALFVAATSVARAFSVESGQGKQQEATPNVRTPKKTDIPKVTEDSIKAIVPNGEWVCEEKDRSWEKAFRLKLTSNKLTAVTPTGPILPITGNAAVFDGAMTSRNSDTYSKFGFWEISADVMTLKWYAAWHEDPAESRALARAYGGVNRYPGEIQIDAAIIDNLERGISILDVKNDNFMGDSFEIKIEEIEPGHFSGKIRGIRPPSPRASGMQALEYEPVSGKIRTIPSPGSAAAGSRVYEYKPIRCGQSF